MYRPLSFFFLIYTSYSFFYSPSVDAVDGIFRCLNAIRQFGGIPTLVLSWKEGDANNPLRRFTFNGSLFPLTIADTDLL